jgi:stage II sporulation protein D
VKGLKRRAFAQLTGSALVALPCMARATGGLDVTATPQAAHQMRVLLASGDFAAPAPLDGWHFAWDGRTYRGSYDLVALPDGRRGLVNVLPLDAYLYGVLSKEVAASWAPDAQRAQAIVSRTYALLKLRPAQPYDVVASVSDQVYGGIESETVEGRAAVDATSGTIVTYGALPAHVAYSSCCGGRTADAGDVWNVPYPYLPSMPDPHCLDTPEFLWDAVFPHDSVAAAFGQPFAAIGALRLVHLDTPSPDDRPRAVVFTGTAASFSTTPKNFRAALGARIVRSTFVRTAELAGDALRVSGTGRGHGVGMCQWGARVMADQGASATDILAFYFPGTSLGTG